VQVRNTKENLKNLRDTLCPSRSALWVVVQKFLRTCTCASAGKSKNFTRKVLINSGKISGTKYGWSSCV